MAKHLENLELLNGRVLLEPIEENDDFYGNIILSDQTDESVSPAKVILTSNHYNMNTDTWIKTWVKPGQKVLVHKFGCQKTIIDNIEYWLTDNTNIVGFYKK
jgi:co-chaperonin GroES (HSP10)